MACGKTGSTGDARHTLADARELCGGLGYHRLNQISPLQHDYEIAVTFGGDNTVLGYQASRFALREREALAALLDTAIRGAGRDADEGSAGDDSDDHQAVPRLLGVMRRVCEQLLEDVDRQGPGPASTAWARAVYQTLAFGHWAEHEPTETGQALLRHYAAGCVLEHGVTALRADILTQPDFLRIAQLYDEEGAEPVEVADLLALLDVPEALITAPIAHADFADRHLGLVVPLSEDRPGLAAVPFLDPA